jgi:hypothetical protein
MLAGLDQLVLLYPCTTADSANALDGIMAWIKEHGLLYSDTASHLVSSLVQQMEDVEHLFAVPLVSRWLESHLWYGVVQHAAPLQALGGRSPFEVWNGARHPCLS